MGFGRTRTKAGGASHSQVMSANQKLVKEEKADTTVQGRNLGNHRIGNIKFIKCKETQSESASCVQCISM